MTLDKSFHISKPTSLFRQKSGSCSHRDQLSVTPSSPLPGPQIPNPLVFSIPSFDEVSLIHSLIVLLVSIPLPSPWLTLRFEKQPSILRRIKYTSLNQVSSPGFPFIANAASCTHLLKSKIQASSLFLFITILVHQWILLSLNPKYSLNPRPPSLLAPYSKSPTFSHLVDVNSCLTSLPDSTSEHIHKVA